MLCEHRWLCDSCLFADTPGVGTFAVLNWNRAAGGHPFVPVHVAISIRLIFGAAVGGPKSGRKGKEAFVAFAETPMVAMSFFALFFIQDVECNSWISIDYLVFMIHRLREICIAPSALGLVRI